MVLNKIKLNNLVIFILLLLISITYINHILFGGFGSGDDINFVLMASDNNYNLIEAIKNRLLGTHASRPIHAIIFELTHYLFKTNAKLYIIAGIIVWLLTVLFICFVLLEFFSYITVYIFAALASFPFFATTIFSGPYLFTGYIFSVFFWSISLLFFIKFAKNKKIIFYLNGVIFFILSLLTLEYIIPLIILSIFLPILCEMHKNDSVNIKLIIKFILIYILPVIVLSLLFFIFKIYIVKLYTGAETTYGTAPINIKSFLQAFYFLIVIFIEIPLLLIEVIPHILTFKHGIVAALIVLLFFILKKYCNDHKIKQSIFLNTKLKNLFILIIITSLFLSTLIFFISFYPANSFGYYNKMMLPSFIIFSILISILISRFIISHYIYIPSIIVFLWIASMIVQLDNFVKSWELRKFIMSDLVTKINNTNFENNYLLVANVPYFLKENYNNERVFFTTWNFKAHLELLGANGEKSTPISYRILTDNNFYPNHNILNKLHFIPDSTNVYYYEYEEKNATTNIQYLGDKKELLEKFEVIKFNKINYHPIIMREKIRLKMIKFIKENIKKI